MDITSRTNITSRRFSVKKLRRFLTQLFALNPSDRNPHRVVVENRLVEDVLLELLGGFVHRALVPRPGDQLFVGEVRGDR